MNLIRTAAPADLAELMLQSVCDHLRRNADLGASPVIAPPDLAYIRECTAAAVAHIDGPRGRIRRALLTQTWQLAVDCFPAVIEVPLAPIQSISSLKYIDVDGVQQTILTSLYRLSGAQSWQPEISPAYGESWPDTRGGPETVQIEFVAGFGDDLADIPEGLLMAIRQLAAHFYAERQPVSFTTPQEIPMMVNDLLAPWRVYR